MKRIVTLAIALAASGFACSSSSGPAPAPTGHVCPEIAILLPQLAFPIPGATGVPTSAGNLLFYGSLPGYTGTLSAPSSASLPLGPFTTPPSPLPSPIATPGQFAGTLAAVSYPNLAPATTYTIAFSNTGPCATTVSGPGYTFTTR